MRTALRRLLGRSTSTDSATSSRTVREYPRALVDDISEAELDRYGFTVVRVLDAEQVSDARQVHQTIGVAPDDPGVSINWSFHSRSDEHKRTVDRRLRETIGPIVDSLFIDHTPFLATYITKWPGANSAFGPHQDPSLVDERVARGFTVWIPLTDTGLDGSDNGLLRFVPGSHRFSDTIRSSDVDLFEFADYEELMATEHSVGVGLEAGEALIFDNRVIHFSMPNATDEPRVIASFGMRPSAASCILLRRRPDERFDVYPIDDSFYLDVLPVEQHAYMPSGSPTGTVDAPERHHDLRRFREMCTDHFGIPDSVRHPVDPPRDLSDPGAFCVFCGTALDDDATSRSERNNAQLVCETCAASHT